MGITKITKGKNETIFIIQDLYPYGERDISPRTVIVKHDELHKLPQIIKSEIETETDTEFQHHTVLNATIVFKISSDNDYSSSTYRAGAHTISGPFIVID